MATNANRSSVSQGPPGYVEYLAKKTKVLTQINPEMNYPGKGTPRVNNPKLDERRAKLLKKWHKHLAGDLIIGQIADGLTLKKVLSQPGMPSQDMIREWRTNNWYDFEDRLRAAEKLQADSWADEIIDIIDDERLDPKSRRIRYDGRKWLMARRNPDRYGERLTIAGDPSAPLRVNVAHDLSELSDSELAAFEAFAKARQEAKTIDVEYETLGSFPSSINPPEGEMPDSKDEEHPDEPYSE